MLIFLIAFLVIGFVYLNKGNKDKPAIQTIAITAESMGERDDFQNFFKSMK